MAVVELWNGVPLNPERDGWHWLKHPEDLRPFPSPWSAELHGWPSGAVHSPQGVVDLGFTYLGPCPTPAEHAAAVQAERAAMAEAAAKAIYQQWHAEPGFVPWVDRGNSVRQDDARRLARRAMDFTDTSALAAAEARAEARGMERAARWHDEQAAADEKLAERMIGANADAFNGYARKHRKQAATIRALTPSAAGEGS